MEDQFIRSRMLLGDAAMERLRSSRVAVFGVGGVGGHTVEALARCGIGALDLIDNDTVALSNINRQVVATHATLGMQKVDAAKDRILSINPECQVRTYCRFYLPETSGEFDFTQYDYIVDAIDTVAGKIALAVNAQAAGTPLISAMGAGNKLDPTAFRVTDIYKTEACPLARVMRHELKKRGIKKLKVVYSTEAALTPIPCGEEPQGSRRSTPGSVSFVPSVAGLIIAGEVIKDLCSLS